MERILFRNEGWIGHLAASRAAHFICFFIQHWDVHSSFVLILQSEKWPFSVAPWLVDDGSLRQNHYRRHRHLLRSLTFMLIFIIFVIATIVAAIQFILVIVSCKVSRTNVMS